MTGLDGGHEWDSRRPVKRDERPLPQRAPPCTGTGVNWWCYTVDNYRYGFGIQGAVTQVTNPRSMIRVRWSKHMGRSAGKIVNHHIPYNPSAISTFMLFLDRCEASTEAQTSYLELTRASVDRFTQELPKLSLALSL